MDAMSGILATIDRYPVVALGERHMLQEMHDLITALLFHPDLPGKIDDIVVEFGNSAYQNLADRFVLEGQPVGRAELEQIWRQIGDPTWNAPIYEQFFRSVRAINWMRPLGKRMRVLLGQPPVTMDQVLAHPTDRALLNTFAGTPDDQIAAILNHEVLGKGRKALLVAGGGHTMRGLRQDTNPPQGLSAVSQVLQQHPGAVFSIDLYLLFPASVPRGVSPQNPKGQVMLKQRQQIAAHFAPWPRPALAQLAGTWLGAQPSDLSYRALPTAARYEDQADAILYLGPATAMTASQPDPAIYHWGNYPGQLQRATTIAHEGDQLAIGEGWAKAGPDWFALFGQ
jgi:hypothetical protein